MKLIFIRKTKLRIPRQYLLKWLSYIHPLIRQQNKGFRKVSELIVVFVDKKESQKINAQFRGCHYPTDILSFKAFDPQSLGELVVCVPVLKQQAVEHGHPLRQEMAYMLLHGLLHLYGYEHEQGGAQEKKMMSLQDHIFSHIDHFEQKMRD